MAKEWRYTIDLPPIGTPRPQFARTSTGKTITYYPQHYQDYLEEVQRLLHRDEALNDTFFEVMATPMGVKAEIKFFCKAPKHLKELKNIMRTTAPDIDNLEKAAFDSIFKGLKIKDSRIVMVAKAKFQEIEHPRTEIVFRGLE